MPILQASPCGDHNQVLGIIFLYQGFTVKVAGLVHGARSDLVKQGDYLRRVARFESSFYQNFGNHRKLPAVGEKISDGLYLLAFYFIKKLHKIPAQIADPITPEALQAMASISR